MGLLGLAFHPNYPTVPYFYVAYTQPTSPIVLARYTVNPATPDVADPGSAVILLYIEKPADEDGNPSPVHNGGDLNFGPHRYLYVSWGDGGPDPVPNNGIPGDPFNNSQRTNTMLGKIIRLDVDSTSGTPPDCGDSGYAIPPGNPYTDGPGEDCDEIWATGLRNPWRFSFDRLTGDMYIGDVGEWEREEIDFQPAGLPAGLNYGWHCFEGTINYETVYPQVGLDCGGPELYTPPIFEYEHTPSGGFSTVGGFVYRGSQYPSLYGYYVTADFNGNMWVLRQEDGVWVSRFLGNAGRFISTFGEGVDGELYVGVWDPSPNTTPTLYHVTTP
jgi:glucose/arabinose dehydrogenase